MPKDSIETGKIGTSMKRREDVRFLTGNGRYTDDMNIRGQAHGVFLRLGEARLELFQAEGDTPDGEADGPHGAGVRHIAFQVDDVAAALEKIGSAAPVTLGPLDFSDFIPGWKTAWVRDPDGVIVEISQGYQDDKELAREPALAGGQV